MVAKSATNAGSHAPAAGNCYLVVLDERLQPRQRVVPLLSTPGRDSRAPRRAAAASARRGSRGRCARCARRRRRRGRAGALSPPGGSGRCRRSAARSIAARRATACEHRQARLVAERGEQRRAGFQAAAAMTHVRLFGCSSSARSSRLRSSGTPRRDARPAACRSPIRRRAAMCRLAVFSSVNSTSVGGSPE